MCNVSRETQTTDRDEMGNMFGNEIISDGVSAVPVFVYGSLRPGAHGSNDAVVNASVLGPWEAVTVGELYAHECGAYPVLCESTEGAVRPASVVGDVYLIDEDHADWLWLYSMETRAGYRATWKDCALRQTSGEWRQTKCIAFMWEHAERGERVDNGDWLTVTAVAWPKETR